MSYTGLDFETFGKVDLPKHGLHNYVRDPSFRPLIASIVKRHPQDGTVYVTRLDFVFDPDRANTKLEDILTKEHTFVAHNASFERAVLGSMGLIEPQLIDSAVIARAVGAGGKLEAAAPQLLDVDKMEDGLRLIKKFSMPQPDGFVYVDNIVKWTSEDFKDWETFGEYCDLDALLSMQIAEMYAHEFSSREWSYELLTQKMNDRGWPVDVELVEAMRYRYEENLEFEKDSFHARLGELNFRSTPQLRKWCAERGVRATSFDELNVTKLLTRISKERVRLSIKDPLDPKIEQLGEVRDMLVTKQLLGGSSLSKLDRVLEMVGDDHRLRGQYLHVGAGQTFRTSGRGVQMQNLKRIGGNPREISPDIVLGWGNDELSSNIRQVFTASDLQGRLIIGDLSSIESRGLAYLAGAEWKLNAYAQGKDMYKVQAVSMGLASQYDSVTPDQRQTGKVGELSCGYGAGPGAVRSFAEKMGTELTESAAGDIVTAWRESNPEVVKLWAALDAALHDAMRAVSTLIRVPGHSETTISIYETTTPHSVLAIDPSAKTLMIRVDINGRTIMRRWFQGCFYDGRDVCYMKPSELKSGPLWHTRWTKNGQSGRYKLYGGKLAGILTQSLCREIFMEISLRVEEKLKDWDNLELIGQFHDELILDWSLGTTPASIDSDAAQFLLEGEMRRSALIPELPMQASVKTDYRYTK